MTAWGLIAGLRLREMRTLRPGRICDLFVLRRMYDDEQHGIRRKKESIDADDADFDDEDADSEE